MKRIVLILITILLCSSCKNDTVAHKEHLKSRGLITKEAMVVSAREEASKIGIEILKKGGNAIDAAVAVGFALAVTYPRAGNIGGGGFMIIRKNDNKVYTLDYREKAPIAAFKDMYLDENKNVIENLSLEGYLASGVPGGRLELRE